MNMREVLSLRTNKLAQLTLSAMFLALALVLPFLTGQIPEIGSMLLPMHLPVLLCGFVCGWPWGLAVGLIAPLLRSLLFGMPPLMPHAIAMAFEMATYGAVAGLVFTWLKRGTLRTYIALVAAMLAGRAVWGLVSLLLYSLFLPNPFTAVMFVSGAFLNAWPGILVQLLLVPPIVAALARVRLFPGLHSANGSDTAA
jgi:riboflavin transporter FmnP